MVGDSSGRQDPENLTLRIDLEKRRWCPTYCSSTDPIIRFTDTEIVLIDRTTQSGPIYWSVNRQTGAYYNYSHIRRLGDRDIFWRRGTCQQQAFTGFGPDDPLRALEP